MEIALNPTLDAKALAAAYSARKRLQVCDVLNVEPAERIYTCLTSETPWLIGFRDGEKDILMPEADLNALGQEKLLAMQQRVLAQASQDFQFIYSSYPLMDEGLKAKFPELFLYKVVAFLNSPAMLSFIKTVTGVPNLVRADAQATWYRRQNFLTLHNDFDPADGGKRVAYVLSFCRDWRPDWGGLLQFYDEAGNIEEGFLPRFNALSLFTTPQNHAVSFVTPFCGQKRLAITGWFRDR
jgi:Rps23 Pro-64 3,4-dihydroxylase Tpa1-like proline 4-hydroxylase